MANPDPDPDSDQGGPLPIAQDPASHHSFEELTSGQGAIKLNRAQGGQP